MSRQRCIIPGNSYTAFGIIFIDTNPEWRTEWTARIVSNLCHQQWRKRGVRCEGAAQILWKDVGKKEKAAAALKIAPSDLLEAGIVDTVIPAIPQKGDFASLLRSTVLRCFRELMD